jgi:hypothetical protein
LCTLPGVSSISGPHSWPQKPEFSLPLRPT